MTEPKPEGIKSWHIALGARALVLLLVLVLLVLEVLAVLPPAVVRVCREALETALKPSGL